MFSTASQENKDTHTGAYSYLEQPNTGRQRSRERRKKPRWGGDRRQRTKAFYSVSRSDMEVKKKTPFKSLYKSYELQLAQKSKENVLHRTKTCLHISYLHKATEYHKGEKLPSTAD